MTATQTLALADFLLARIAEDEARAPLLDDCPYSLGDVNDSDWSGAHYTKVRVLAECEAKRRIVEDALETEQAYRDRRAPETEARRYQAMIAVGQVATIYADHPDYSEDWRP